MMRAAIVATCIGVANPPLASAGPYTGCKQAAKDGVFDIPKGDPNYDPDLDSDGDGIACEKR